MQLPSTECMIRQLPRKKKGPHGKCRSLWWGIKFLPDGYLRTRVYSGPLPEIPFPEKSRAKARRSKLWKARSRSTFVWPTNVDAPSQRSFDIEIQGKSMPHENQCKSCWPIWFGHSGVRRVSRYSPIALLYCNCKYRPLRCVRCVRHGYSNKKGSTRCKTFTNAIKDSHSWIQLLSRNKVSFP